MTNEYLLKLEEKFREKGVETSFASDDENILQLNNLGFDHGNVCVCFKAHDRGYMIMKAYKFAKIPKDQAEKIYPALNQCCLLFDFVKFYYDDEMQQVVCGMDFWIHPDTFLDEALKNVLLILEFIKMAYPIIMKALWA